MFFVGDCHLIFMRDGNWISCGALYILENVNLLDVLVYLGGTAVCRCGYYILYIQQATAIFRSWVTCHSFPVDDAFVYCGPRVLASCGEQMPTRC